MQGKRIAIFGGNFDPPHHGHVLCVTGLLNSKLVDEVWIVPTGNDRKDKQPVAPALERQKMLELMLGECFKGYPVKLDLAQVNKETPPGSFTIDLLKYFKNRAPSLEYHFVIGVDNLDTISTWKQGPDLIKQAQFLAIPRLGRKVPSRVEVRYTLVEILGNVESNISSSYVREALKNKACVAGMLPKSVLDFLEKKPLYF